MEFTPNIFTMLAALFALAPIAGVLVYFYMKWAKLEAIWCHALFGFLTMGVGVWLWDPAADIPFEAGFWTWSVKMFGLCAGIFGAILLRMLGHEIYRRRRAR